MTRENNRKSTRKFLRKWLIVASITGIVIAVLFYKPLPSDITSPHHARFVIRLLENIENLARLLYNLRICPPHLTARTITDALVTLQGIDYTGLRVNDTKFEDIPVRIYAQNNKDSTVFGPGIFFIHGGAWMLGSIDSHDVVARTLAKNIQNIVVVSVEYRRSPEFAYPVPLEDCLRTYKYFYERAEEFGVDKNRIAIMGDSAGGNLAAAATLKLRTENKFIPKLQVLVYPVLQALDLDTYSYRTFSGVAYGDKEGLAAAIILYSGQNIDMVPEVAKNRHVTKEIHDRYYHLIDYELLPEHLRPNYKPSVTDDPIPEIVERMKKFYLDPYFMPLMESNLTGLPPAYVVTAQYDCIRDDGLIYAARLLKAGVDTVWKNYERGFHAILNYIVEPLKTDEGIKMMGDLLEYLHKNL